MSDPFIGEIRIFANNFYPLGWLPCNGGMLSIQGYQALYAVIGTIYGGNGQTTFALPNLTSPVGNVGLVPIGAGTCPGLTSYNLGETAGVSAVTLTNNQTPAHNHNLVGMLADDAHTVAAPTATSRISRNTLGATAIANYSDQSLSGAALASPALGVAGGGQPHENRQPYLALNYYIAVEGIFPSPE